MMNPDFEIYGSTILAQLIEMKGDAQYKNWTAQHNIDKLTAWMASMAIAERRNMAAMGAMR
eukprot:8235146-Heterocapsa_arctica.AAC.1